MRLPILSALWACLTHPFSVIAKTPSTVIDDKISEWVDLGQRTDRTPDEVRRLAALTSFLKAALLSKELSFLSEPTPWGEVYPRIVEANPKWSAFLPMGLGRTYLVDKLGRIYTPQGVRIVDGHGTVQASLFLSRAFRAPIVQRIRKNAPAPVLQYMNPKGQVINLRAADEAAAIKNARRGSAIALKEGSMQALLGKLRRILLQYEPQIDKGDVPQHFTPDNELASVILLLIYYTNARCGNIENGTPGISTLQRKHVSLSDENAASRTMTITLPARGGEGQQVYTIVGSPAHKDLQDIVDACHFFLGEYEEPSPNDYLFSRNPASHAKPPLNQSINKLLKALTGEPDITTDVFRFQQGTALFNKLADEAPLTMSQAEAEDAYKRILNKVADMLNHRPVKARNAKTSAAKAISPDAQAEFFETRGLTVPQTLQNMAA